MPSKALPSVPYHTNPVQHLSEIIFVLSAENPASIYGNIVSQFSMTRYNKESIHHQESIKSLIFI